MKDLKEKIELKALDILNNRPAEIEAKLVALSVFENDIKGAAN